jgi:type II secretory pathway pseudopilin PulG
MVCFILLMFVQVAVIQSDARAELEAAQTRMQLLRLKQQRMAKCLTSSQLPTASDTLSAWRDRR